MGRGRFLRALYLTLSSICCLVKVDSPLGAQRCHAASRRFTKSTLQDSTVCRTIWVYVLHLAHIYTFNYTKARG